jgi:hypothetical protein
MAPESWRHLGVAQAFLQSVKNYDDNLQVIDLYRYYFANTSDIRLVAAFFRRTSRRGCANFWRAGRFSGILAARPETTVKTRGKAVPIIRKYLLALGIAGLAWAAQPVQADPPQGYPDFTFRRIGVPKPGQGPRITVQIDPAEQARRLAARPPVPAVVPAMVRPEVGAMTPDSPAPIGRYGWYWALIPPGRDAGPVPVETALAALGAGPMGQGVPQPRLQALQDIAARHGADILRATIGTRVSPALVLAVISVESAGKAQAVSPKGAQGLMQLIPATARRFDVAEVGDPVQNIRGGVAYLDWLMGEFAGDPLMVLAGYNAGEGAVRSHGGVPPFAETRDYVPKVLAAWNVARGLCRTPPELVSDGCVFRLAAR